VQPRSLDELPVRSPVGEGTSFADIAIAGPENACYPDEDHYVAEFLYQNPQVCLWQADGEGNQVLPLPVPAVPKNAIRLPPPSGGNDTGVLESIINASAGRAVVGSGTYAVDGLDIKVSVDIHDMPMRPWRGAGTMVTVEAPDVRVFSSPIDGSGSSSTHTGFDVEKEADRFVLIDSGFSNIHNRTGANVSGVRLRGAADFHVACNTFENILNQPQDQSLTARANSIWMNGNQLEHTSGGVIANNVARDHQSRGARRDAEFLTVQSFLSSDPERPTKVFANRAMDVGKRFSKHQQSDALVLSNRLEWSTGQGPLGARTLLAQIGVHQADNVVARNNRIRIAADSRFDYVFHTVVRTSGVAQDNIRFDCNAIEIADRLAPESNSVPHIVVARAPMLSPDSTSLEATNSSASHNRVHGAGSVRFHYWFGAGYRDDGGSFETIGNVFDIPATDRVYK